MSIPFIDLKSQYSLINESIQKRINQVLDHGQYVMGPEVYELEEVLAKYVGVKHCISASSGTDTLLIALMALGVGAGDEVITSPFTFIATGEMIALAGATPVFVDVDPKTYNIDPSKIEAAITKKTKAILPVSIFGQCADYDAINEIAKKHGLPVIEDAAQSFGAEYKGRKSCSLTTIGSTSFFPSKPLGAYGDGGALFTNDDSLAEAMRQIRLHGQKAHYVHTRLGINGRLDTIQAAVLLAKMEIFPSEVTARNGVAEKYSRLLQEYIDPPYIEPFNKSVFAQYTLRVNNRSIVQEKLKNLGVPTAVHYPTPLHLQPVFSNLGFLEGIYPVSENVAKQVISLPMSPYLTDDLIKKISSLFITALT